MQSHSLLAPVGVDGASLIALLRAPVEIPHVVYQVLHRVKKPCVVRWSSRNRNPDVGDQIQ